MKKLTYKVIHGNKKEELPEYEYIAGVVTNTRLMGVIAMKLHWKNGSEDIFQLYHFDAEEYGFDNFQQLINPTFENVDYHWRKMAGGLGGQDMPITQTEAKYIFQHYFKMNNQYCIKIPKDMKDYAFMLKSNDEIDNLDEKIVMEKICEPIKSDFHLINYYIMRGYGLDQVAADYLKDENDLGIFNVKRPVTLIRNENIYDYDYGIYHAKALIEYDGDYRLDTFDISVDLRSELKIKSIKRNDQMIISDKEAAMLLNKPEYITTYTINGGLSFKEKLDQLVPQAMKNEHENGVLYILFNPNNDHVKERIHMLSNDIRCCYFVTHYDELIVTAYSEEIIGQIEEEIAGNVVNMHLERKEKLYFEQAVLYGFVQSGYYEFKDFINALGK